VLPLIQRCFSREEMARLVGTILGERPGELMDTILAMMFRCAILLLLWHTPRLALPLPMQHLGI